MGKLQVNCQRSKHIRYSIVKVCSSSYTRVGVRSCVGVFTSSYVTIGPTL